MSRFEGRHVVANCNGMALTPSVCPFILHQGHQQSTAYSTRSPALARPLQRYRTGLAGRPRTGWSRPCMQQHTCIRLVGALLLLENTHTET